MIVTGNEMLQVAHREHFAVPAFNIGDYAMLNGIMRACEELEAPVILALHPDELRHLGQDVMASILQIATRSCVPVAVHVDHGTTFAHAVEGIRVGFTSVMIDGSLLPFEDNVEITRRVVEVAHLVGVSVEGELGTIGRTDIEAEEGGANIVYTEPDQAVEFVRRTGVDSLAVSIGTSHGIYPSWMEPRLELGLLKELARAVDVPLVLHGGSGNPDDEIRSAAQRGISKINISSDLAVAYHQMMRKVLEDPEIRLPFSIQPACIDAVTAASAHKIRLFGAAGKAELY